jgi:UDP-N-acetylglucosamine pyrophosphorylase
MFDCSKALKDWKILDHMKELGVEYVHVFSVDNVLSRIGDPVFTALCAKNDVEIGSKVCPKVRKCERILMYRHIHMKLWEYLQ